MLRRPPRATRTDTLFPYTTLFRSASSGLGRHFGLLRAANGAHVALAARSIDRVADTAKAITDQGGKALAVALDVIDRASVDAAVARIEDELGPIQILEIGRAHV